MDPKRFAVVPDITQLPQTAQEAAGWIWDRQDELNALSLGLPDNVSTVEIGASGDLVLQSDAHFNYRMALTSEVSELMDNRFWKHWSKEAKQGLRFTLVHPEAEAGHGTRQNELVEITDIAFFVVSILQVRGFDREMFVSLYGDEAQWAKVPGVATDATAGRAILEKSMALLSDPASRGILLSLTDLWRAAEVTWQGALNLYAKKLIENYRRQIEGRRHLNDEKADAGNLKINI